MSADNNARVEMSAATAIEDPPAPSCASGTGILPYLYTVFLWFIHGSGFKNGCGREARPAIVMSR